MKGIKGVGGCEHSLSALKALSFNSHDKGDGSILIPVAQKTNMKLREVKECIQDATASVTQAGFKGRCVWFSTCALRNGMLGLPCGPVVKNLPAKAVDTDLIPGLGRSHLAWGN